MCKVIVNVVKGGNESPKVDQYDEAMEALSSLITKRSRADKSNKGDRFDLLFDYIKASYFHLSELIGFWPKEFLYWSFLNVIWYFMSCRYWN